MRRGPAGTEQLVSVMFVCASAVSVDAAVVQFVSGVLTGRFVSFACPFPS